MHGLCYLMPYAKLKDQLHKHILIGTPRIFVSPATRPDLELHHASLAHARSSNLNRWMDRRVKQHICKAFCKT